MISILDPSVIIGVSVGIFFYLLFLIERNKNKICKDTSIQEISWQDSFDALNDPYVLTDLEDKIVYANNAFYELIGKDKQSAKGKIVAYLIHKDDSYLQCDACKSRMSQSNITLTKEHDDASNPTKNPVEIVIRSVKNKSGQVIGSLQSFHDISHIRCAEERLRKSEHKLTEAQRIGQMGNWEWDLINDTFEWSEEMWRIFGCPSVTSDQNNYTSFMRCIHKQDRIKVREALQTFINNKSSKFNLNHRVLLSNGEERHVHHQGNLHYSRNNQCVRLIGITQDITDQKLIEDKLSQEKEKAQVTLQSIGDAVITMDVNGIIDYVNPVAENLLLQNSDGIVGRHHTDVLHIIDETTRLPINDPVKRSLNKQQDSFQEQILLVRPDNTEYSIAITTAPIIVQNRIVTGVSFVIHDVTKMRSLTKQLNYQATHDALTSLVNRREFERRIKKAIYDARTQNTAHALIYMDLDQFKIVNDTCGHIAGDELLKQVSQLLQSKIRSDDTLARLGGDEFAVLLTHCPPAVAKNIAEEIRIVIENFRFAWEDKMFKIGVSIGLIPIDINTANHTEVLKKADTACYVAKDSGRNRIYMYDESNRSLDIHHGEMQWAQRINQSLECNHFQLYCQTIKSLDNQNDSMHFEVLLRMLDSNNEVIPPQAFIPAAERYQLMPLVDRWVIHNTFSSLQELLQHKSVPNFLCSINLSAQSLCDDSMLHFITEKMDIYEIAPENICFEITETTAISNLSSAIRFINVLRDMGIRFALDDFGSGLSSFDYLKNLNVDYLKIDGSFVKDIVTDNIDHAMVRSINEIGHLMGVKTVAEFVENDHILSLIEKLNIDYGQGHHLGKPIPIFDYFGVDKITKTGT